jgi:hypothetical protein
MAKVPMQNPRTLEQVKAGIAKAERKKCGKEMAQLMLKHGRLTVEARAYVSNYLTSADGRRCCPSTEDGPQPSKESYTMDRNDFANPGGNSALRAASRRNPRNLPCPTCKQPNKLTPKDRAQGYQCDDCANAAEGFGCF